MVFPLHEETVSREEGRRLAKARYHKIHNLNLHLKAKRNLSAQFEAMTTVSDPAAPAEIKVLAFFAGGKKNKRKNYVPRCIVQVCSNLW